MATLALCKNLGDKRTVKEVAEFFEIELSTAENNYTRYGGVKIGRKVLFFDNLISEAVRSQYAIQTEKKGKNYLERPSGAAGRKQVTEAVPNGGSRKKMGKDIQAGNGNELYDPFGLAS
jgi:hypothetical protein